MKEYARWLTALAKRVLFVHKACLDAAAPDTLSKTYIVALDLDAGLRLQQMRKR